MSMSTNLHHIHTITVSDIYPYRGPGETAPNIDFADKDGNKVTVFADDAVLRKLVIALQAYAATKGRVPATPVPTYTETLFAPVVNDMDDGIPF